MHTKIGWRKMKGDHYETILLSIAQNMKQQILEVIYK
jgi:hypothetical protein